MSGVPAGYPVVSPYLLYEDADRAVAWLEALGFRERRATIGAAGRTHHELTIGADGLVMVGQMGANFRSARSLGVHPPFMVHIYVADVTTVFGRAKDADIEATELEMSPAGDKRFTATDPEGIAWVFAERVEKGSS